MPTSFSDIRLLTCIKQFMANLQFCFQAVQLSGKSQFPYMVDPNTRQQMGESDDIINYLYNEYGDGNVPLLLKLGPLTAISNILALLPW